MIAHDELKKRIKLVKQLLDGTLDSVKSGNITHAQFCILKAGDECNVIFNHLEHDPRIILYYIAMYDNKVRHQGIIYDSLDDLRKRYPDSHYKLVEKK